ncbi:MAG TPA: DUF4097 family beta strand repeat-containing protein [Ilumatobacteraceae bacterium]|nr:DUF4097 family beta strand repeat-containing protein [Ilumatobacteraceae bacterium]
MFRFTTPVPPRLSIELRAGTVAVDTAEVAETTVELVPLDDSRSTKEAIGAALVEQHGDDVVVHVPERFGSFVGRAPNIAVRVAAPDDSALRVKTGSAAVTANGRYGTTKVDTGSGDVELGVITDSARVNSGSGDVRIERVDKDVAVKTGSGDVVLGTVAGEISFSSGSGDLELVAGGRALVAKTGSGNVVVGAAPADVRVTTASGDIRIDAIDEGEVRAKAASGDIQAGVRGGAAAWLDVRTVSGRVSSGLDARGEPEPGQRQVRLQLSTVSGDIDLARV